MFSLKGMVFRKTTIDNSVRYILKSEQLKEIEQNTIKSKSTHSKQNKNIHKTKKIPE